MKNRSIFAKTKKISLLPAAAFLAAVLFAAMLLSGCSAQDEGKTPAGTWYEQSENGGILIIESGKMTYRHYDYTFETTLRKGVYRDHQLELIPDEEYWVLIDIFYDADNDIITGHDLPHTDGDGGYHLITFKRTEYVAPPEPVYGDRTDTSDPDAKKDFSGAQITRLELNVTEPFRANGDMAPEQPDSGDYWYLLTVNEDGTGLLSSNLCQDITITKEQVSEINEFFINSGIASLNGLDILTEGMPEDTQYYKLSMEFDTGDTFYSRANGKDVSLIWDEEGYRFHQLIFDMLCDAGYNCSTGQFHSTQAMKRIGLPEGEKAAFSISTEEIKEERFDTAYGYEYDVYSKYPVFAAEGDAPDALMDTLEELSSHYKELALANIDEDMEALAQAPKALWDNAERHYAYSFYAPQWETVRKNMFTFWISEGHSNSMGVGKYEYGYYPNWRFAIDTETGKLLCANDLFTDNDAALKAVTDALCSYYYNDELFTSEDYQKALAAALDTAEFDGGAGIAVSYDGVTFYLPIELSDDRDYPMDIKVYYDAVQDILNDRYCSVW